MTTIYCNKRDCKHISKRRSKKYSFQNGKPCLSCTLKEIFLLVITPYDDGEDEEALNTFYFECSKYEKSEVQGE